MSRGRRRTFAVVAACLALPVAGGLGLVWPDRWDPMSKPAHRSPEAATRLPDAGPIRLLVFGTSLSARALWPDRLAQTCAGGSLDVTRIARAGAGSDWAARTLPEVIATRPDVVLMEFTINDADMLDGLSLDRSTTHHRAILSALTEALPDTLVWLMTTSPAHGPRGWVRPRLPRYHAMLRDLAAETGAGLLDLTPIWRKALSDPATRRRILPDGLHPDPEAEADLILPALIAQVIARLPGCEQS